MARGRRYLLCVIATAGEVLFAVLSKTPLSSLVALHSDETIIQDCFIPNVRKRNG
jgi:hypothetical protein